MRLFSSTPLRISPETTYITEPLTADGSQVDYFAAIAQSTRPANASTDENGYRLLVQQLGGIPGDEPGHFAKICQALDLDLHSLRPTHSFEEPRDFLTAHITSDTFDQTLPADLSGDELLGGWTEDDAYESDRVISMLVTRLERPWTLDELPMMARWLDENNAALDLLGHAVRRPTFHIPLVRQDRFATILEDFDHAEHIRMHSFARGLRARANYRIGIGDIDGGIADFVTCRQLAQHVGQGPGVMPRMIAISIEEIANAIGIAGTFEHPPSPEQLKRLLEEIDQLPPNPDFDTIVEFERLVILDAIQVLARGEDEWGGLGLPKIVTPSRTVSALAFDWNVVAQRFNEHYLDAVAKDPDDLEYPSKYVVFFHPSARQRSKGLAEILTFSYLPALTATHESIRRVTCARQLKHITLAMLSYEREHGSLPPAYSVDGDGKPLHSWRVLLLPYLGQEALYGKLQLDEPWDSDHNQQFHGEAVAFYRCPSNRAAEPGHTTYSVVVGPDMPFEAGQGRMLSDFEADSDDMILVVERFEPICWMDPTREIPQVIAEEGFSRRISRLRGSSPGSGGMGSYHPGAANFGLRSGAVRVLADTLDREQLQNMLRGASGQGNGS